MNPINKVATALAVVAMAAAFFLGILHVYPPAHPSALDYVSGIVLFIIGVGLLVLGASLPLGRAADAAIGALLITGGAVAMFWDGRRWAGWINVLGIVSLALGLYVLASPGERPRRAQQRPRRTERGLRRDGAQRLVADELVKLAALRDLGVLSQQEFESQKAKLLG